MTGVERAGQAVAEARDRLIGFALVALPNEPSTEKAEKLADDLVRAVEARCAERHAAERETARDRARETARRMFAGLMPGATGDRMADEIADKILAAIHPDTQETP